jgi:hypothetical protein
MQARSLNRFHMGPMIYLLAFPSGIIVQAGCMDKGDLHAKHLFINNFGTEIRREMDMGI